MKRNSVGGKKVEEDFKAAARKQFFKYFRFWFIIIAVLLAVCAILAVRNHLMVERIEEERIRTNYECGTQRVFDYADVLTEAEEQKLADLIAKSEEQYKFDIVVVTIRENVEAKGDWEEVMRNLADDFFDQGNYGYDKVHGDGILLLDNWYRDENGSQAGSWLSTCGNVYAKFGMYEIDKVLDQVDLYIDSGEYKAYSMAIQKACELYHEAVTGKTVRQPFYIPAWGILAASAVMVLIYAMIGFHQDQVKDTTTLMQYVEGGKVKYNVKSDTFLRKNVTSVKIQSESSSGSSGGGRSGGYGGGHVSSGGVSHGGGGHRR